MNFLRGHKLHFIQTISEQFSREAENCGGAPTAR